MSNTTNLSPGVKAMLATIGGGAVGALALGLMARAGIKPTTASAVLLVGGGVTAATTNGALRAGSAGVAASGGGQLALDWLAKKTAAAPAPPAPVARQGLGELGPGSGGGALSDDEIDAAFDDARRALANG